MAEKGTEKKVHDEDVEDDDDNVNEWAKLVNKV